MHDNTANLPPRGPGRPKGSANKITRDIKEAIAQAFDQVGGVEYLAKQARDNPQAFMTLLGKIVPSTTKHEGDKDNPVVHTVEWRVVKAPNSGSV